MDKKKKLWVLAVICVLWAVGISVGVYQVHTRNAQKKEAIENAWQTFEGEKDRTKRLSDYQDFAKDESLAMDAWYDKIFSGSVKTARDATLSDMRRWFTDDYDKIFKENSISLEAVTDNKEAYENAKVALTFLQETIKSDKVLSKKESKTYQKKIAQKMTDYDTALAVITVNEKKAYYDALISDNTFDNVDSISSKSKLNTAIANLNNTLESIKNETIFDETTISNYETTINTLVTSYNNRITTIEENEKAAAATNNNNNNSSSSSSSNGSNNNGKFGGKNPNNLEHDWFIDENGNTYNHIYTDPRNGNRYDENGNKIYNLYELWEEY